VAHAARLASWWVPFAPALGGAATPEVERVHFAYEAPAGCPSSEQFLAKVWARTARARLGDAGESGRRFTVKVASVGAGYAGQLSVEATGGEGTTRTVSGSTCEDVTTAFSLIMALAIDPQASTSPDRAAVSPPNPAPSPRPRTSPSAAPSPTTDVASRNATYRSEGDSPSWRWAVGLGGGVDPAIAPTLTKEGAAFVEIARERPSNAVSFPSLFRWSMRYARAGNVDHPAGSAQFAWYDARLEGCPLGLWPFRHLESHACLFFDAGLVRGEGHIANPSSADRPWLAAGSLARVRYFWGQSWFFEAQGGVAVPLRRDTFVFDEPRRAVYQVPSFAPSAAIALGYRFGDQGTRSRP
jgi:hypothetical protein